MEIVAGTGRMGQDSELATEKKTESSSRNILFKKFVHLQFKPMYVLSHFQLHLTSANTLKRIFSNPD